MKTLFHHRLRALCASTMLIGFLTPSIVFACGMPYITISKAGPATVHAGEVIVYSVTVTNHTVDSVARYMIITDAVPAGLTFVANQSTAAAFCNQSGNVVTCYGQQHDCAPPSIGFWGTLMEGGVCRGIGAGQTQVYLIAFKVPDDAACGTTYTNQASIGFLMQFISLPQNSNPNPNSNVVTTTVVCQSSSSSSSSIPSSSSSSSSSSTPASSSSSSTPSSSSSSSTPSSSSSSSTPASSSSSSVTPIVTIPGNSFSNSNAFASNLSNNQNTQNVSIFNAGANISVGAPNINVNTGGANVAVSATASPSTAVANNTQGAAQYQPLQYPPYPQYPSYPPPPVYPMPQPPVIIEKPVVIPPPIIVQPLPQTGIGDFTGSVEDTRRFLSPISESRDGGLIATAFLSLVLLFGATGFAGVATKKNFF